MRAVRVRRRPWMPFLVALAGLPMVALAYDFATGARLLSRLGPIIYPSEVDPFELRDAFLASLFGIVGAAMVVWGLRELVFPQTVVRVEERGLRAAVRGPLGKSTFVPWEEIEEIKEAMYEFDGEQRPALAITVSRPGELPTHPWGATWVGPTLVVDAAHWDTPLEDVVNGLVIARRLGLERTPPEAPPGYLVVDDTDEVPVTIPGSKTVADPQATGEQPAAAPTLDGDDVVPESESPEENAVNDLPEENAVEGDPFDDGAPPSAPA